MEKAFYITGSTADGMDVYYFIKVMPKKIPLFIKDIKKEVLDLTQYGEIIHSGYGRKPSAKLVRSLKKKYAIENL